MTFKNLKLNLIHVHLATSLTHYSSNLASVSHLGFYANPESSVYSPLPVINTAPKAAHVHFFHLAFPFLLP